MTDPRLFAHVAGAAAAQLDLHLPLAELLPDLGLPTTTMQQQQGGGVGLPLGLSLEPQSVLQGLAGALGGGSSGSSSGTAAPALA